MVITKLRAFLSVQVPLNQPSNKSVNGLSYRARNGKKTMFRRCFSSVLLTSMGNSQNKSYKTGMLSISLVSLFFRHW